MSKSTIVNNNNNNVHRAIVHVDPKVIQVPVHRLPVKDTVSAFSATSRRIIPDFDVVSLLGKRPSNEDKHVVIQNKGGQDRTKAPINFYGVFDGHGGKFVSKFVSEQLPSLFTDVRVSYPLKKHFINASFEYYNEILRKDYLKNASDTGSTCLIAIQYMKDNSDYLNILNIGDSRAIMCTRNLGRSITYEHKPGNFSERARITKLGGEITFDGCDWRIKDLSVCRAFGDLSAHPYLTCEPDLYTIKLSHDDKFMVLACDGLWDVMSTEDVVNFVLCECYDIATGLRKTNKVAKKLGDYAINVKQSTDNITIIVVFFD